MTTTTPLSKYSKIVQDALAKQNLEFTVLEFPSSTRTAKEAAETIGCDVAQIVKSLIFRTQETYKPILVLASGINRVNEVAITAHLGEEIEKADADFTREVTGFAIGGIPPIAHKQSLQTFIDEDLLVFGDLWAAAGTPNAVFKFPSNLLSSLTAGKVISIK